MLKYVILQYFVYSVTAYSTWCGKHYELGAPDTPPSPESYFSYPSESPIDLLDFRCIPASSLYLPDDLILDPPAIIIDAKVTRDVGESFQGSRGDTLHVDILLDGQLVTSDTVVVGMIGHYTLVSLAALSPRKAPYDVECAASLGSRTYTAKAELLYLPDMDQGSVVKLDGRTGATWVREHKQGWESMIPFGWYDSIDVTEAPEVPVPITWLDARSWSSWIMGFIQRQVHATGSNAQRLAHARSLGFNMIHPVPPGKSYANDGDSSAINAYFDKATELGIWIMYDLRHAFLDLAAVEAQVLEFRHRPNLLTWYIADEPDGHPTPHDSTQKVYNLIRRLDPYHPISLVLNCKDHYWDEYTRGTDIVLADVYSVAINPIWSKKWSTPVTSTFGASGCDQCRGNMYDLVDRLDEWEDRKRIVGRKRDMITWVVPQAFDDQGEEFWWRVPTGNEGAMQIVLAWNHGVMGHCAWLASSATPDLLNNASYIASHLYAQRSFLIDSALTRRQVSTTRPYDGQNGLDVAAWSRTLPGGVTETLVMAVQMNYISGVVDFGIIGTRGEVVRVLFGEVYWAEEVRFRMGRTSVAAAILRYVPEREGVDIPANTSMPLSIRIDNSRL